MWRTHAIADSSTVRRVALTLAALLATLSGCGSSGADSRSHTATTHPSSSASTTPAKRDNHPDADRPKRRKHARRLAGVPSVDLPVRGLTPGAILTRSAAKVCVSGYSSSVRDVPESEKEAVYARYDVRHIAYRHEVDHLISLELGGSNAIANLWPEPYAGRWGARTKDVLENRLHDLVCSGSLALAYAQRIEARNWVAAYRRYVGAPPAGTGGTGGGGAGAAGPGCEHGYSPCLPKVGDLDCADIPDAKKPVHVTGRDPYRLDADGDGVGCE